MQALSASVGSEWKFSAVTGTGLTDGLSFEEVYGGAEACTEACRCFLEFTYTTESAT